MDDVTFRRGCQADIENRFGVSNVDRSILHLRIFWKRFDDGRRNGPLLTRAVVLGGDGGNRTPVQNRRWKISYKLSR